MLGVPTWAQFRAVKRVLMAEQFLMVERFPTAEQFPMVVEECLMAQHRMEEDSMVAVVADMEVATAEADTVAEGEADEDRITA